MSATQPETKKPSKEEMLNRQMAITYWNQSKLEVQVALVLGVGGVGSSIIMALLRLGIQKIFMVDYDVVDASNLNRQILFTPKQIGMKKVDAALETANAYHNLCTEIVPCHMDAVVHWGKIVEMAKQSTVIFNGIDFGAGFDVAAGSLALSLGIPYAAGSTYSNTWIVDFYHHHSPIALHPKSEGGDDEQNIEKKAGDEKNLVNKKKEFPCVQCSGTGGGVKNLEKLHVSLIQNYASLEGIIEKDKNLPTGQIGSFVCVCVSGSLMVVDAWVQQCINGFKSGSKEKKEEEAAVQGGEAMVDDIVMHTWSKFNLLNFQDVVAFSVEKDPKCKICGPAPLK